VPKPVPLTPGCLGADLMTLFASQSGDVDIQSCNDVTLKVHSAILSARCPTLLMTRSDCIRLPDHSDVLKLILSFLYSDTASISVNLCVPVHIAATRLNLPRLAALAQDVFVSAISPSNIFSVLQFVEQMPELRHSCLNYLVQHPELLAPSTGKFCSIF
jgi:hypothetical protein